MDVVNPDRKYGWVGSLGLCLTVRGFCGSLKSVRNPQVPIDSISSGSVIFLH